MRFHSKRLPKFRKRRKIARRRNSGLANRLNWIKRRSRYKRNPDPHGEPWGPELYNPLDDNDHPFKNEAEYRNIVRPLYRRNPYLRNPYGTTSDEVQGELFLDQILSVSGRNRRYNPYSNRRRNPYGYVHDSSDIGQVGLYKSIFSRKRRRKNPYGLGSGRRNPSYRGRIGRRNKRRNRRRYNPFGQGIFDTINTGDAYWDRGRV